MENDIFAGISSGIFTEDVIYGGLLLIHMGSMVCMFDTIMSPVKMAELIKMPFGL